MLAGGAVALALLAAAASAWAADAPTIDGFPKDAFWTAQARAWTVSDPELPDNSTRFYLGVDERFLYFAADVTDGNVLGSRRGQRAEVWHDDSVALYLDFGDGTAADRTPETFEYAFGAAGGANWTRGKSDGSGRAYPGHDFPAAWNSKGEWAIVLKPGSSLNVSGGHDRGYVVEARIPWSELGQPGPVPAGQSVGVCMVNYCRPEQAAIGDRPLSTVPGVDPTNVHDPRRWQRVRLELPEALPIRGVVDMLPLYLGSSLYAEQWRHFELSENDPAGPWLNRERWAQKLEQMGEQRLNALMLLHPHPFPGLLALADYPGAGWFSADELATHTEQFRWLLAEAGRHGIDVYLLTWNICLPAKWAESQRLEAFGSDTPLSRAYTRYAVMELLQTYPELGGMATMAGEHPPGCVDFVVDAIAGAFTHVYGQAAGTGDVVGTVGTPELIFSAWCSYPEDARRVLDAYPRTRLMHYLQYEQWFKPMVDPRAAWFATWAAAERSGSVPGVAALREPLSMITLGGPKSSLAYLFWGDPAWMHALARDIRRTGADGIFFEPYCLESWLAQEALATYTAASLEYDAAAWEDRLAEVYGVGRDAGQLLEVMQRASAILPRFTALVHSQSDHYMPQFGLPLTHYLEMPTLSSYVYENTQAVDERGYLTPRLGLTWPNPDWGEKVASIRDELAGTAVPGATRPEEIANKLREHVKACRSGLQRLRRVEPDDPDRADRLGRLLDRIDLTAALGEHFEQKIRAAVGWERLRQGRGRRSDCTMPLKASVRAWGKVVEAADRLYPEPVRFWQSQMNEPRPWAQNQLWESYRLVEGHWRDQLPRFQRELDLINDRVSTMGVEGELPLWDELNTPAAK